MVAIVSRGDELIKVHLNTMQSQHKSATFVSGILLSSHLISMYKLLIWGQILFHYSYANKLHSTSNVQQLDCSLGLTTQKTSKPCNTGPMWGEPTVDQWTPSQRVSNDIMLPTCYYIAVIQSVLQYINFIKTFTMDTTYHIHEMWQWFLKKYTSSILHKYAVDVCFLKLHLSLLSPHHPSPPPPIPLKCGFYKNMFISKHFCCTIVLKICN